MLQSIGVRSASHNREISAVIESTLSPHHLADLRSSGLSDETIRAADLSTYAAVEVHRALGRFDVGAGLAFPYPSRNGSTPFVRIKPDKPPIDGSGRPCKYLTAAGAGNRLYLPPILPKGILQDTVHDLLITEGEKKALAATQASFPCIGLSGVWCWRGKGENGQSGPIADLDYIEWEERRVYIVFDSDLADKPEVQRAESALAEELQGRGAVVRVVRLPDGPNGTKVGLDDFLVQEADKGPIKLRALLRAATPSVSFVSSSGGDISKIKWDEPQPLPDPQPHVEPFDIEMLPSVFRPWIADIADRMQCPTDYPAVGIMIALATVVGRQVAIRPKHVDDWQVVPNLWGGIVGRPGLLKTPALQEALRPLAPLEIDAKKAHDAALQDYEAKRLVAEARQKDTKDKVRKAVKAGGDDAYKVALAAQVNADEEEPKRRRYRTNDTSVEKLGELLNENPRGLLVFRDELTGFLKTLDKDGHEADRAFYLESWNGTGRFVFDRIGRGTTDVEAACVSVLGGIQPGPFKAYVSRAARGGTDDDGLVQRFQLVVWPDTPTHWRNVDTVPDSVARRHVFEKFEQLDRIDPQAIGAEMPTSDGELPFLRFSPEAQEMFTEWRTELERHLRRDDLPSIMEAHISKYRSLIPSLALLIHLVDVGAGPVGVESLLRACTWGEYLESHAQRVYAPALMPSAAGAKVLAGHIEKGDLGAEFAARDVQRKGWAGLTERDDVVAAIELLEDLDWVQEKRTETPGRTRTRYLINPQIQWDGRE